jgi:hypothetical protein
MPAPTEAIRVSVERSPQSVRLVSPEDVIQVWTDGIDRINKVRNDSAAWHFLPIAMRTGRDLRIEGEGSGETVHSANLLPPLRPDEEPRVGENIAPCAVEGGRRHLVPHQSRARSEFDQRQTAIINFAGRQGRRVGAHAATIWRYLRFHRSHHPR